MSSCLIATCHRYGRPGICYDRGEHSHAAEAPKIQGFDCPKSRSIPNHEISCPQYIIGVPFIIIYMCGPMPMSDMQVCESWYEIGNSMPQHATAFHSMP